MAKASTPWGASDVVEELTVPQRAGDKRFATIVQLLSDAKGEELVRFAYSTGGTARRGPSLSERVTSSGYDMRWTSILAWRARSISATGEHKEH
jgi:hypothetical protein